MLRRFYIHQYNIGGVVEVRQKLGQHFLAQSRWQAELDDGAREGDEEKIRRAIEQIVDAEQPGGAADSLQRDLQKRVLLMQYGLAQWAEVVAVLEQIVTGANSRLERVQAQLMQVTYAVMAKEKAQAGRWLDLVERRFEELDSAEFQRPIPPEHASSLPPDFKRPDDGVMQQMMGQQIALLRQQVEAL